MGNSKFIRLLLCTLTLIVFFGANQGFSGGVDMFGNPRSSCLQGDTDCSPIPSQQGAAQGQPAAAAQQPIPVSQPSEAGEEAYQAGQRCNAEVQAQSGTANAQMAQRCMEEISTARIKCDADKDNGMISATRQATQAAGMITQMTGGAAACSGLGQVLVGAQGALAGFQANCGQAQSRCQNACSGLNACARECNVYKNVYAQAVTNMMGAYQMLQSVKACGNKLGSSLAQMCAENPALPVCAAATGPLSCNDPQVAATNVTCICQNNPADPRCGSVDSSSQWSSTGVGSDGSKGPTGDPFGNGLGDLMGGEEMQMGTPAEGGDNQMAKGSLGGGGGASLGGGGTGSAGSGGGTGRGGSGVSADVLKGSYGGRGGGGAGGGRYGSNSEGNPGYGGGTGDPSIDLNKFLPGGKMDPSRGLAGVSGPDGITGPNSDIWKKIRTRYFSVSSSMRP